MTATSDSLMSAKNDGNISPYLRRPLRSLTEYLKEVARLRNRDQRDQSENDRPQPVAEDSSRGEDE